ncbi:uncharacterized protein BDW43DRAFT_262411 [Aspergillus alliaceus]|uniref:uncharacterized protein n=1 Tax=Petromyces alliaceus TaxID=209559 RepID=UPI0012A4B13E|nr:uncharacterized protein BDW43DRAFT_262411 [Aspergillus alliaceus]KAB8238692.1 hypothetical protein BDW43DRAFT_262411 [Aspergillus alliaceus]
MRYSGLVPVLLRVWANSPSLWREVGYGELSDCYSVQYPVHQLCNQLPGNSSVSQTRGYKFDIRAMTIALYELLDMDPSQNFDRCAHGQHRAAPKRKDPMVQMCMTIKNRSLYGGAQKRKRKKERKRRRSTYRSFSRFSLHRHAA